MNDTKPPGTDDNFNTNDRRPAEDEQANAEAPNSDLNVTETEPLSSSVQPEPTQRSTAAEVASGLGISALVYALLWAAFASQVGVIIMLLSLILLGGGMVWSIKLMRSGRTALGLTMLTAFSIPLLALLTVGACALLFFPPWG